MVGRSVHSLCIILSSDFTSNSENLGALLDDATAPDQDKQVKQSSSSSDFTSDSEDFGALLDDATMTDKDPEHISSTSDCKLPSEATEEENAAVGKTKGLKPPELDYLLHTSDQSVSDKRHVERLDYKKLLEEKYENSSSDSSDEEFGATSVSSDENFNDTATPQQRRITCEKTMFLSPNKTPITKSTINTQDENQEELYRLPKRTRKDLVDGGTNKSSAENVSFGTCTKRSAHKRLGEAVTQVLRTAGRLSPVFVEISTSSSRVLIYVE